ncbi:heparinase II/III family protein [Slackia piriformis]|uniref:heparinase II/III family protein n=1 Tax=Slackia piriformis TaxID=626934 RepID=UPI0026DB1395|nr:heparinase II/III family protein [Slackia piriformis]MDO5023347.1 heparinase II/III family protein [Slackia piriformis]
MLTKSLLYLRTIVRMKPGMILSRLRGQKTVSKRLLGSCGHRMTIPALAIEELDCDSRIGMRFDIDALAQDEFFIINNRYKVDLDKWSVEEASHLWNFNLHYFEYCIPLAVRYREHRNADDWRQFKRIVSSWVDACSYAQGDAWHPYTISLRLVNWLICLDLFGEVVYEDRGFFQRLVDSMYLQYRHLLLNQEKHLLANHYFENLKTLLICAAVFDERDVHDSVLATFEVQLDEQILNDGVHFERSLMYHKLILEGLLRVDIAARYMGYPLPSAMREKEQLMLDAMSSLERGMGKTPFFNDAAEGVAKGCGQIVAACENTVGLLADDSKTIFPDAGYYKLYDGDMAVMFDAGDPGPRYMLGHAHCDALSFELSVKGKPLVVNSGTYGYQSELRSYFRSTAAHNTCVIDGEEQLECWGEHRVARGARSIKVLEQGAFGVDAILDNYRRARHRRHIRLEGLTLEVEDSADGSILASLTIAPEAAVFQCEAGYRIEREGVCLLVASRAHSSLEDATYSSELGVLNKTKRIVFKGDCSVSYSITLDSNCKENE